MRKTVILFGCLVIFGSLEDRSLADARANPRVKLISAAGENVSAARGLLTAIEKGSKEDMRRNAIELVRAGRGDVVLPLLRDASDAVKQEAVRSVSGIKKREVAQALLSSIPKAERFSVKGGAEAIALRIETRKVFIETLENIVGVSIGPKWTNEEISNHLGKVIDSLPE
jgi:hypothetical protein